MKKIKLMSIILLFTLVLMACGNSVEQASTSTSSDEKQENENEILIAEVDEYCDETDYTKITGIYVDESYKFEKNDSLKLVYVFYDVFTNSENLKVCSKSCKLTVDNTNTYESAALPYVCKLMSSFFYSNYIKDVYVGETQKVVATFNIPSAELEAGKDISFLPYGVPDAEKIKLKTDDIITCSSVEEIASIVDPIGYEDFQSKYEEADSDTANKVREAINGYQWDFYVNKISYQIEFFSGDRFQLRASLLNTTTDGSYIIRKGFISVTNDSNGHTTDIPWSWGESDIDLDVASAYNVVL